ncbi:MAG: AAA family ATPase, partial [Pseudomonadota bacterium]|nr:AAA family ATPase [Pseudomonadota bacterium]
MTSQPYYLPLADEVDVFRAAYAARLPVLLKGPTGCGKTRFVEHMTWLLAQDKTSAADQPLITVSCHEDLTATDMVGRYLLKGDETIWSDGPLTRAVRSGAVCYLDEIVEARKDTTVLIHSLTDHRRILPIDKTG